MDVTSPDRCLGDSLLLLLKQEVGSQKLWLFPQLPWEAGETLRQTAQRALGASLPGNVPASGFYTRTRTRVKLSAKPILYRHFRHTSDGTMDQESVLLF